MYVGTKKEPDASIDCEYLIEKSSQANGGTVLCFRHLSTDKIFQIYVSHFPNHKTSRNYKFLIYVTKKFLLPNLFEFLDFTLKFPPVVH